MKKFNKIIAGLSLFIAPFILGSSNDCKSYDNNIITIDNTTENKQSQLEWFCPDNFKFDSELSPKDYLQYQVLAVPYIDALNRIHILVGTTDENNVITTLVDFVIVKFRNTQNIFVIAYGVNTKDSPAGYIYNPETNTYETRPSPPTEACYEKMYIAEGWFMLKIAEKLANLNLL